MTFTKDPAPAETTITVDSGAIRVGRAGPFDVTAFDPDAFDTGDVVQFNADAGPTMVTIITSPLE